MIAKEMKATLDGAFAPSHFVLLNESHQHNVPADSETHFKLTLVSAAFRGVTRVRRHQLVYAAVQRFMDGPVHALSLHLYDPEEWECHSKNIPASPNCRGGELHDR